MRDIADYKVIKTDKALQEDIRVLAQVSFKTKTIHIRRTKRTTLEVLIAYSKGVYKTTMIDFKTADTFEKFLLYHEIRHIENKESMRYIHFTDKIDEEIDCNLFSLKELQKLHLNKVIKC